MKPDRFLAWSLWAVVLFLLVPLSWRVAWDDPVDFPSGGLGAGDFKAYYIAARLLARGQNIYDVQLQDREMLALGLPVGDNLYFYPSELATVLIPVSNLSLADAARLWNLVNLGLLAASLFCLIHALDLRRMVQYLPLFVILFALAAPTMAALRIGQANILVLLLLIIALAANRTDDGRAEGLALAAATIVKIFPAGFLVWFIWKRRWRTVAWMVGGLALIVIVNATILALVGADWTTDARYVVQVLPYLAAPMQLDNQSLTGFLGRFGMATPAVNTAAVVLSLAMLAVTLWLARHESRLGFAAVLIVLLLGSSITWSTTLVLLLIPFAVLVERWIATGNPSMMFLVLAPSYLLVSGPRLLAFGGVAFQDSPWLLALPFYGALSLWLIIVWEVHTSGNLALASTRPI